MQQQHLTIQSIENTQKKAHISGLTVIEVVIIATIILILFGIILNITLAAKAKSKATVDISNLRQLAIAAELYAGQNDDLFPLSAASLAIADPKLQSIVTSPVDNYAGGYLQAFWASISYPLNQRPNPDFPVSYVGAADGGFTKQTLHSKNSEDATSGWLILLLRSKEVRPNSAYPRYGIYHRLNFDGSVKTMHTSKSQATSQTFHKWFHD